MNWNNSLIEPIIEIIQMGIKTVKQNECAQQRFIAVIFYKEI